MASPFFSLHHSTYSAPAPPRLSLLLGLCHGSSRLHSLSWRVLGWAGASHHCFWGEVKGCCRAPGPGMRLIYELINWSSVWASETAEVCELFHVTVCACWLKSVRKTPRAVILHVAGLLGMFSKAIREKMGLGVYSSDGSMICVCGSTCRGKILQGLEHTRLLNVNTHLQLYRTLFGHWTAESRIQNKNHNNTRFCNKSPG